jgi:6-phosphogluconolactonase
MVLTPDGRYLLVANRTQGGLVSFQLNPETGELLDICSRVPAPEAVSIVLSQHTI